LTATTSPTTTGKIERLHLTLRRELLEGHEPFASLAQAQIAIDVFVAEYNSDRPHQALDGRAGRRCRLTGHHGSGQSNVS
jgi:transposase InsO family protein